MEHSCGASRHWTHTHTHTNTQTHTHTHILNGGSGLYPKMTFEAFEESSSITTTPYPTSHTPLYHSHVHPIVCPVRLYKTDTVCLLITKYLLSNIPRVIFMLPKTFCCNPNRMAYLWRVPKMLGKELFFRVLVSLRWMFQHLLSLVDFLWNPWNHETLLNRLVLVLASRLGQDKESLTVCSGICPAKCAFLNLLKSGNLTNKGLFYSPSTQIKRSFTVRSSFGVCPASQCHCPMLEPLESRNLTNQGLRIHLSQNRRNSHCIVLGNTCGVSPS